MAAHGLALYVAASAALIATPGQDMVYVVTRSLAQGRRAGVASAVGVSLGILVHTALVSLGAAALLRASETLFVALKLGGAAYLVYLGARLLAARAAALDVAPAATRASDARLAWQGVVSNVTNPKVALFFLAFLPQFVDPASAHPTRDLVFLGVLYAAMALPVKAAVGLAAASLSRRALASGAALAWMNRASGAVLVALGVRLAVAQR